jgi:catechol 2,3-dioxygenase-like lactoylglutathione lyase family enzyme
MFDHVTVRIADLAAAEPVFQSLLDQLSFDETFSSNTFAMWNDFALTEPDDEHPLTRRAHVAFVAPAREAVDAWWEAGVAAGLRDNGPPGPRPNYSPDYYGAFLLDEQDNNYEAVHRDGHRRGGNVDHVAIRVADVAAATAFYKTAATAAGFELRSESEQRASFTGPQGGLFSIVAGPPTEGLHIAFPGDDDAIRRFYADEVALGHRGNGEPGERPRYHPGYYAAYVLDPDGNNIEVVDHHRGVHDVSST